FARNSLADAPAGRPLTALSGAFVLSLLGVLAARDPSTFLGFWELMTLFPAVAILYARRDAVVRHAVFVYLAITHIGGAGVWVALTLLAIGALSALGGVLYAIVQRELKRLLAFSSIENVGIIVLALGAAVLLTSDGHPLWSAIAFAAALLHVANHAAFKGLLF